MNLSIIIPAYNEEKRIGPTLEQFGKFFNEKSREQKLNYQILVVINGTRDKTEDVVKKYQKRYRSIRYLNLKKGGKGFAVTEGIKESLKGNFDLIGYVDADLATPAEEFWKLVENIKNYGGIIADRYMEGSKITPAFSFRRLMVGKIYNFLVKSLFLIHYSDTQCGAKLFKRDAIEEVLPELELTNWSFEVNILHSLKKRGFRIKAIPTIWFEVEGGNLRILLSSIQMFFAIIQLRILKSSFKGSLRVLSPVIGMVYKVIRGK